MSETKTTCNSCPEMPKDWLSPSPIDFNRVRKFKVFEDGSVRDENDNLIGTVSTIESLENGAKLAYVKKLNDE